MEQAVPIKKTQANAKKKPKQPKRMPTAKVYSLDIDDCLFNKAYQDLFAEKFNAYRIDPNKYNQEYTAYLQNRDQWCRLNNNDQPIAGDEYSFFVDRLRNRFRQEALIEANHEFIKRIVNEIIAGGFTDVEFILGSNRQDQIVDQSNFNCGGSGVLALKTLVKEVNARIEIKKSDIKVQLDPTLSADIFNAKKHGYCSEWIEKELAARNGKYHDFETKFDHLSQVTDQTKITLLYLQIHKICTKHPGKEIIFNFCDDSWRQKKTTHTQKEILDGLLAFFGANPKLIPYNLTLELDHYDGGVVTRVATIRGEGEIDHTYAATLNTMVRLTGSRAQGKFLREKVTADNFMAARRETLDNADEKTKAGYANAKLTWAEGYIAQAPSDYVSDKDVLFGATKELRTKLRANLCHQTTTNVSAEKRLASEAGRVCIATASMMAKLSNQLSNPSVTPEEASRQKFAIVQAYQQECKTFGGEFSEDLENMVSFIQDILFIEAIIAEQKALGNSALSKKQNTNLQESREAAVLRWSLKLVQGSKFNSIMGPVIWDLSQPIKLDDAVGALGKHWITTAIMLRSLEKSTTLNERIAIVQTYQQKCKKYNLSNTEALEKMSSKMLSDFFVQHWNEVPQLTFFKNEVAELDLTDVDKYKKAIFEDSKLYISQVVSALSENKSLSPLFSNGSALENLQQHLDRGREDLDDYDRPAVFICITTAKIVKKLLSAMAATEKLAILRTYQAYGQRYKNGEKDTDFSLRIAAVHRFFLDRVCVEHCIATGQKTLELDNADATLQEAYATAVFWWSRQIMAKEIDSTGEDSPLSKLWCKLIADTDGQRAQGVSAEGINKSAAGKVCIATALMLEKLSKANESDKLDIIKAYIKDLEESHALERFGKVAAGVIIGLLVACLLFTLSTYCFSIHDGIDFLKEITSGWEGLKENTEVGMHFIVSGVLGIAGFGFFTSGGIVAAVATQSKYGAQVDAVADAVTPQSVKETDESSGLTSSLK